MRVTVVNFQGAGYGELKDFADGTTVGEAFKRICGESADPLKYNITLQGLPCTPSDVIRDGEKLSFSPQNIKGAKPVNVVVRIVV